MFVSFRLIWLAFTVPVFSLVLGYTGIAVWKTKDNDTDGSID